MYFAEKIKAKNNKLRRKNINEKKKYQL